MTTIDAAIAARALTKRFGRRTALDSLDLTVPHGSVFGLIGPNGAGKSTTMRLLLDILRPSSGSVEVLGQRPRRGGAALRRRIGYLPGEVVLPRGRGDRVLDLFADISDPAAKARIPALAERLEVDLSRRLRTLSKGNKQKIAIIQAFMHEPDLLILDEPTSGLDPLVQQTFLDLVREARDNHQTVFLSSHVLSEIQHVADSAAVLNHGKLVTVASIDDLRRSASRTVTARISGHDESEVAASLARIPSLASLTVVRPDPSTMAVGTDPHVVDVTGTVDGHADELVKSLARFHVVELTVEAQDLEQSVLSMYGTGTSIARPAEPTAPAADPNPDPEDRPAAHAAEEEN